MNSLTEEQRRRMEENRRKALEKRAAAAARAASTAGSAIKSVQPGVNLQSIFKSTSSSTKSSFSSVPTNQSNQFNTSNPSPPAVLRAPEPPNLYNAGATTSKAPQPQAPPVFTGKTLAGPCVMVARDKFMVDIGYNQQLIAIFRSIKGHQYDSNTRKWTFPISEHSALLSATACLRPMVAIGSLPPYVLRVFRTVQPGVPRSIPPVDLGRIDKTLVTALMPFQTEGVQFGISRNGRCLIGDDMGLGKSIQALGIAHYYYQDWPLLIVCPSSMRYAWRESIWNWLPSVCAGSIYVIETGKDSVENAKVLITSYDMLGRRSDDFLKCGVVIMDESHHLKNPKTARTKAAIPLMQNAKRLILLSGTPALSRPIELFTQISSIKRDIFPTINDFGVRYCGGKKNAWGWDFSGSSNMEELQLILEETIMIRRMKSDVLQQLPAKLRKLMVLDPSLVRTKNNKSLKATAAAFNAGKNLKSMERRGKLLEYYSETAMAKIDAVTAYLKELIEDGKKFICFAHHKSMMEGIGAVLENMKTRYIKIDGSTSAEDRQTAVDVFQHRDDVPVALLSITAANSGITLTAANLVIFAELYWNPGILVQAEDRAHRIGQMDSVLVEYLVAGGTADDVLWPMVQEKLKVLNKAGLSKDNFGEANATALIQGNGKPQQMTLDDFMMSQDESEAAIIDECKELENDQCLLDQLLDESFN